jgi:N,N-dimethylformamidase beta subunit-like protein
MRKLWLRGGILLVAALFVSSSAIYISHSDIKVLGAPGASEAGPDAVVYPVSAPPGPVQLAPSILANPPQVKNALLVQAENAQPGTADWRLTNYAAAGEIQAYTSDTSINAGSPIQFYVSTKTEGTPYKIDFYRMGWYGGAGARRMSTAGGLRGSAQGYWTPSSGGLVGCRRCQLDKTTGLVDANWLPSYKLDVPSSWLSGVYLAILTDAQGKQTYVPFVVRQDDRASALLLKTSVNTYEAYNAWGGKSLYTSDSAGAVALGGPSAAVKVSFNRPFDADFGSGHFLRYEYNLVRWVERNGYDVTYATDQDLSENSSLLLNHRAFISAGHDEYWTASERDNVEQALAHGVDLAFLSGDAVYWQARYEQSSGGSQDRTLVVYRSASDPLYKTDPKHATVRWQDPPINNPENLLTGTIYSGQTEPFTQDWVAQDTSSWLFAGTGLKAGDHVPGIIGKEFDRADPGDRNPIGLQILSHSPVTTLPTANRAGPVAVAESTIYTAPSGAMVFSAGTVTWSWGLDDSAYPLTALHKTPVSPGLQRLTKNLLDAFSDGPPDPP